MMERWQVWLMFAVNLTAVFGFGWKAISVLVSVRDNLRDELRDIRRIVGYHDGNHPTTGLVLDVHNIKHEVRGHRDTLIEITSEMGLRHPGGRS